jgi:hypothetical protein
MSVPDISKIHLNLIRAFRYYPKDESLNPKFSFLRNNEEFYTKAIEDVGYLGSKDDNFGLDVGKLRSVLDTQSSTITPLEETLPPDPFFHQLQDYYKKLSKLNLTPHYPCIVDILPRANTKYSIDLSSFPGTLSEAKNVKLSASIRIYPAGLAFLRLGFFLSTNKSFDAKSIIDFLRFKKGSITVDGLRPKLSVEELTRAYARMLLEGLHTNNNKILSWEFTYSTIDLIESSELSIEQNYKDFFYPLLSLNNRPKEKLVSDNLSTDEDIILIGPESSVTYLPANLDYGVLMNPSRRKVRRWIRNAIELFSTQRFMSNYIATTGIDTLFSELQNENWIHTLKKGVIPLGIKELFSYWNYTNLHRQNYPLNRSEWLIRYNKILKVLDEHNKIENANKQSMQQINTLREEAGKAKTKVSDGIWKLLELGKDYSNKFTQPN